MLYLDWRRRVALKAGEGYGDPAKLVNEPAEFTGGKLANPFIAILPLILVGVTNKLFTDWIPGFYGDSHAFVPAVVGNAAPVVQEVSKRSEEHTSELQSLMRISYAVFCLKKKKQKTHTKRDIN